MSGSFNERTEVGTDNVILKAQRYKAQRSFQSVIKALRKMRNLIFLVSEAHCNFRNEFFVSVEAQRNFRDCGGFALRF